MKDTIFFPSRARFFSEARVLSMTLETGPSCGSEPCPEKRQLKEKPKLDPRGKKDLQKDVDEGLTTPEKKLDEAGLRDKLTGLLNVEFKKEDIEVTSEEVKNALLYYGLGKHKGGEAGEKMEIILAKIKELQANGTLGAEGIGLNYVGGTDGTGYRLPKNMNWHREKIRAFTLFLEFSDDRIKISGGVKPDKDLIRRYIKAVNSGKLQPIINVVFGKSSNKKAFLKGGGLFDVALAVQRADDMKKRMEDAEIDGETDYLYLELGNTKGAVKERKSGLRLSSEIKYIKELRDPRLDKELEEKKRTAKTPPEDRMLELDGTEKPIEQAETPATAPAKPKDDGLMDEEDEPEETPETKPNLAERVKNERNKIIARDHKGNPSNDPFDGFDATKLPKNESYKSYKSTPNETVTQTKNNLVAFNLTVAARTAAIRARVLEKTGYLPEEIKDKAVREKAENSAELEVGGDRFKLSAKVIDKYLVLEDEPWEIDEGTPAPVEKKKEQPTTAPAPKQEPAKTPETKPNLAERVKNERNKIIARDHKGNPSNDPQYGFDAAKIPDNLRISILGKFFDTSMREGRNDLAQFNVKNAIRTAAIRAKILEEKGVLPEDIKSNSDRAHAESNAEVALETERWEVSEEVLKKYFIEEQPKKIEFKGPGVAGKILKVKVSAKDIVRQIREEEAARKAGKPLSEQESKKPEPQVEHKGNELKPDADLIEDEESGYPKLNGWSESKDGGYSVRIKLNEERPEKTYSIKVPSGYKVEPQGKNLVVKKGSEDYGYIGITRTAEEEEKLKLEVHGKIKVNLNGTSIEIK